MALYTSYYTRQLALRPETLAPSEPTVEGEKTVQKSVARRTVDFTGPYIQWLEVHTEIKAYYTYMRSLDMAKYPKIKCL